MSDVQSIGSALIAQAMVRQLPTNLVQVARGLGIDPLKFATAITLQAAIQRALHNQNAAADQAPAVRPDPPQADSDGDQGIGGLVDFGA